MVVRPEDRRRMTAIARDLAAVETDEVLSGVALERAVADADVDRAARGLPPLGDEPLPEEAFYARARALGIRRLRG
jgi:hypothetical protein